MTNMSSVYGLIWVCCNDISKDDSAELALAGIQDLFSFLHLRED